MRHSAARSASAGLVRAALGLAACAVAAGGPAGADDRGVERFETVVIDAGHGGEDEGAKGPRGVLEKDVVLEVARELARTLREGGLRVVMTREADVFVPLEQRTSVANDARGDLFLSIHANAAHDARIRGIETFFHSLEASDDAARLVAERENLAFGASALKTLEQDPVAVILSDMMEKERLSESQEFARMAQGRMARIDPQASRGVKQAPFVVLVGVRMPASLVEIGFITNDAEERALRGNARRRKVTAALAAAVLEFGRRYDAQRGVVSPPARGLR